MLGLSELVPLAFTGIRRLGWAQLELGAGRGGEASLGPAFPGPVAWRSRLLHPKQCLVGSEPLKPQLARQLPACPPCLPLPACPCLAVAPGGSVWVLGVFLGGLC